MCVCVCLCVYVCMCMCVCGLCYVCIHMHVCICVGVVVYECMCVCTCRCGEWSQVFLLSYSPSFCPPLCKNFAFVLKHKSHHSTHLLKSVLLLWSTAQLPEGDGKSSLNRLLPDFSSMLCLTVWTLELGWRVKLPLCCSPGVCDLRPVTCLSASLFLSVKKE